MKDRALLWASALIIAQHLFFIAVFSPVFEPDSVYYAELGRTLASTLSFDSTVRLPGYPAILALSYRFFGPGDLPVVIFQHLLGLTSFFVLLQLVPGRRPKLLFSAFVFCDLLYTSYQHAILPEAVFAFLLCMSGIEFHKYVKTRSWPRLLACGAYIAAGIFMKPVLKFFPALVLLLLALENRTLRQKLTAACLLLAIPLLAMGGWSLHNYRQKGVFALLPFESVHYVGRFVTHIEFPEGSLAREPFLRRIAAFPPGTPIEVRRRLARDVIAEMKAGGMKDADINKEFAGVTKLSVLRHPFIYAKETLTEMFYFFFSAHNLYAKHSLKDFLPVSVREAIRAGDWGKVFLKVALSLHPLYWLLFLLSIYFTALNWRQAVSGSAPLLSYAYAAIFYIASISCLVNEGLARYRLPLQPFMIFMAALALDRLLPGRTEEGEALK